METINSGCDMMVNNRQEQDLLTSSLRPEMRVLEFGLGLSTMLMARMVRQVVSIEHDEQWYNDFKRQYALAPNISLFVVKPNLGLTGSEDGTYEQFKNYIETPLQVTNHEKFDVIFIDGRARVECARFSAKHYLKEGGLIFIHDYKHPKPEFRRPEYEIVENFLELVDHVFAMGKFTVKKDAVLETTTIPFKQKVSPLSAGAKNDESTCWYSKGVVEEMNRFYDLHIHNQNIRFHMQAFTDLLYLVDPTQLEGNFNLLDLGCGTAMLSEFCKDFKYFGADLPHVVAGCAIRNYPGYFYKGCDFLKEDILWINAFPILVLNGIIDVMEQPLEVLVSILKITRNYLIIHRQEITENGETRVIKNPSYGSETFHSIINRKTFSEMVKSLGFEILSETRCGFGNWENGGSSFLLKRCEIK